MRHVISATALSSGEQLAMCGHVFESYGAAVAAGHRTGNYLPVQLTKSAYREHGVDCAACMLAHARANTLSA